MTARLLLSDCDQFFVQCARLADPAGGGREKLLLVGGPPSGRGVVTSASYETRAFGVRSGMPTGRALRLCPRAKVVPVPRGLCGTKSREVRTVLERFSPVVEPASIDEAYMDLSGTERLYHGEPLRETALRIQATVYAETAIRVSIGGGTSKVVSKLAAGRAKPFGVRIVEPGEEIAFMQEFDLRDIPGVGPVHAAELARLGLVTVSDALARDEATLEQWLGTGRGKWLHAHIRGIDGGVVRSEREARSMSREETFPKDLHADEDIETELLRLAVRLAADVRAEGLRARTITVKLRDADFRTRQAGRTVPDGVETDRAIYTTARELLATLRARRRTGARLVGIIASQLAPAGRDGEAQLAMFEETAATLETDRDRRLSRAADDVRQRFGRNAVRPGKLLDR
jgi:DNA polymerase-4